MSLDACHSRGTVVRCDEPVAEGEVLECCESKWAPRWCHCFCAFYSAADTRIGNSVHPPTPLAVHTPPLTSLFLYHGILTHDVGINRSLCFWRRLSAFSTTDRFLNQFTERVDLNTRAYFAWVYTARWLGFRMDMVVMMVLIASCFFSVAMNEYSNSVGERWVRKF